MNQPHRFFRKRVMPLLAVLATLVVAGDAFAISIKKARMSATTLSVEGKGAVADGVISVDGQVGGSADGKGEYRFDVNGYTTSDCVVLVSDGTSSATAAIASCTPNAPPPNSTPTAQAGANVTVQDVDVDGVESVLLDGSGSSDSDGAIVSWEWRENGLLIGSGVNAVVNFALGSHSVELTVIDDQGASAADTVIVAIVAPQPAPLPPPVPDAILESNQADTGSFDPALMGWSVASAGDVNGDGFGDVVVGAKGWDAPGGLFDEGAVFIFHGGLNGVTGFDPMTADAFIQATEAGGEFGSSVAGAGDVNGDGYDDIIVGAPLVNASGLGVSGAAYVFLGGPQGIVATSPADAPFVMESKQIEGHMGFSVAGAGDVNGDGFDDVIVAAQLYGEPFNPPIPNQGSGRQGAAFVFLGGAAGIVGDQPANAHAQVVPWVGGTPSQPGIGFGIQVAGAGDVNGDGYADVMVGWPLWNLARTWPGLDSGDPPKEGAVFVYHGGPSGITGTNTSNADTRIEGNQLGALFGSSIAAAGDVNGDGYGDIVIGATGYPAGDPLLNSQEGAAFVFLGSPAGVPATTPADAQTAFQGSEAAEWLGRRVAGIGDFDGDGFDDIAVSARIYPGSLVNEGISYVLRGSAAGIVGSTLADAYTRLLSNRENGELGFGIAGAGDVDADGLADIIAGVTGYSGGEATEGAAFVYLGSPSLDPPNQPPVAKAGSNVTLVDSDNDGVELVSLDGSASFDVDGSIVAYEWREGTVLLGSTAVLASSLAIGDHSITLTVTDDRGAAASAAVLVHVVSGQPNQPPVARAGADQSVTDDDGDGVVTVVLDGSASSDPDGTIVDYIWREGGTILGTGATLSVPLAVGVHNMLLQVNDNKGSGAQDGVVVTVNEGGALPVIQAQIGVTGTMQAARGDPVSFTVNLANSGSTPIAQAELVLTLSSGQVVKDLQPGGTVVVADLPAGGTVSHVWTGQADKEGTTTVTAAVVSGGMTVDSASIVLTVFK